MVSKSRCGRSPCEDFASRRVCGPVRRFFYGYVRFDPACIGYQSGFRAALCRQALGHYPDFAVFVVETGIDSISLNLHSVEEIKKRIAEVEK